jgi:glycosyltransferase involved in cell wall biosynthesis
MLPTTTNSNRIEPENHVDVIVDGYSRSKATDPLVVVGSAPYAQAYIERIESLADGRVRFLGAVWDQDLLNALYSNALTYLHGHSVGGTNPSLLRAIGAGAATDAFDVPFNREVLGEVGRYWSTADDVARLVEDAEKGRASLKTCKMTPLLAQAGVCLTPLLAQAGIS